MAKFNIKLVKIFTAVFLACFSMFLFCANNARAATSSNTFTSDIIDTTFNLSYSTISWNATTPDDTSISIKVRSCDDDACSVAGDVDESADKPWASCDPVGNGDDISSNDCITNGDRYVQYEAVFTYTDTSLTPSLDDITINDIDHPCLSAGTTYYFHVKAQNGYGLWSSVGNSDGILNMTSRKARFEGDFKIEGDFTIE